MNINNHYFDPISIEEHEYERLLFLARLRNQYNISHYNYNKDFFQKINKSKLHIDKEKQFLEFCKIYTGYKESFNKFYINNDKKLVEDLYNYYIPLANHFNKKLSVTNPLIVGIQGHQGCGKSTFCEIIKFITNKYYNINTNSLSIDDLYLPFKDLQNLKLNDPRFKYRGPPGTHDINLGMELLNKIKNRQINFELTRFDKKLMNGLGDRMKNGEMVETPIDLFLLEGWFLGAEPIDIIVNDLQASVNENLKNYKKMWNFCDEWIILRPYDFKYSKEWRIEAEKVNKQGLDEKTINDFVDFYWNALPPSLYFEKISDNKKILLTTVLDKNRNIYI